MIFYLKIKKVTTLLLHYMSNCLIVVRHPRLLRHFSSLHGNGGIQRGVVETADKDEGITLLNVLKHLV